MAPGIKRCLHPFALSVISSVIQNGRKEPTMPYSESKNQPVSKDHSAFALVMGLVGYPFAIVSALVIAAVCDVILG